MNIRSLLVAWYKDECSMVLVATRIMLASFEETRACFRNQLRAEDGGGPT